MAKLRMTLPKEFSKFYYSQERKWTAESITQCKEFLTPCDPNARDRGGYKKTALHYLVPFEIAEWLIERGADVNAANTYGTPLSSHAFGGNYDICSLLIEHGADVNIEAFAGHTALFGAADRAQVDIITLLLEHGADPCHHSRKFDDELTPLLYMLRHINYAPKEDVADAAELLVKAQRAGGGIPDEEWSMAQKFIAKIGHTFELYKSNAKENFRDECESAMTRLYTLFDVALAAPVIKHDGKSLITLDENLTLSKQHHELWELLVPASGKCATVQGEVVRITGRVGYESNGNGGMNWDTEYRKMLKALIDLFALGNALDEDDIIAVRKAAYSINGCKARGCEEETDILLEFAVKWVRQNPVPISLGDVNYVR